MNRSHSSARHATFFFFFLTNATQEAHRAAHPRPHRKKGHVHGSGTCLRLPHHSLATVRIYITRLKQRRHEERRKSLARQRRLCRWTRKSRRAPLAAACLISSSRRARPGRVVPSIQRLSNGIMQTERAQVRVCRVSPLISGQTLGGPFTKQSTMKRNKEKAPTAA